MEKIKESVKRNMKHRLVDGLPDPVAVEWLDHVEENAKANSSFFRCRRESRGRLVIEAREFRRKKKKQQHHAPA